MLRGKLAHFTKPSALEVRMSSSSNRSFQATHSRQRVMDRWLLKTIFVGVTFYYPTTTAVLKEKLKIETRLFEKAFI